MRLIFLDDDVVVASGAAAFLRDAFRHAAAIYGHRGHVWHVRSERARFVDSPSEPTPVDYACGAWSRKTACGAHSA